MPVDNFYDKKTATGKQPYAIALADQRLMALARLWENRRSPAGERGRSFTIVTMEPNSLCAELHNRMPVVLQPRDLVGTARGGACRRAPAQGHARALSSEKMVAWPISPRVGNVKNNDQSLIEPIAAQ